MNERVLAVARGDGPADLVFTGGRVVDVFTSEVIEADVAVVDGIIASVGPPREAKETIELEGRYLLPGLMDAHVHLESSMVTPEEYARAVVPRGTTTVVADPHEVANVAGMDGVRWMLDASEGLPLTVLFMAPSCVPATHLATAGAELDAGDLEELARHPRVIGLAEVMNVPGAVLGDPGVHAKIDAFDGRPIDGHGPGLTGDWLQAYAAAGVGTDHETITPAEAREKLRLGMRVWLREGTGARNLVDLLPVVTPGNSRRCGFCTDDRHPDDLLDDGHMDHLVRLAVANGLDPITAIQMATLNIAEAYRLDDRGAVAPGRRADLVVTSDLTDFRAERVFVAGDEARSGRRTPGFVGPPGHQIMVGCPTPAGGCGQSRFERGRSWESRSASSDWFRGRSSPRRGSEASPDATASWWPILRAESANWRSSNATAGPATSVSVFSRVSDRWMEPWPAPSPTTTTI